MANQVRISDESHRVLREMAMALGDSMQGVLEKAVEDYRRKAFLDKSNAEFAALRSDPLAWQEELEERRLWEATLADGLGD